MDVLDIRRPTTAISVFLIIIFPIGISSADRPVWSKSQWETELENFRQKFYPDIKGGAGGPIPELVECVVNTPEEEIVCKEHYCPPIEMIPCSNFRRQLILNEVFLRKQFGSFNENCDSHGTKEADALLDPPNPHNPYPFRNAAKDYLVWQNKLIDSGLKFCDPFRFLRCSPLKKCTCWKDTTWVMADDQRPGIRVRDTCAATDGTECHDFRKSYYKALSSIKLKEGGDHLVTRVECALGICSSIHTDIRLAKSRPTCLYDTTRNGTTKLEHYFNGLANVHIRQSRDFLNALERGDPCDVKTHNQLVTFTKEEVGNFTLRLKNLEGLIKRDPEPKFCNPASFLTCGPSSKCECKFPSFPDKENKKCVFPPEYNQCDFNPVMEQFMMNETIPLWVRDLIEEGWKFNHGLDICGGKQICHVEMIRKVMYCTCKDSWTGGVGCDVPLTRFLTRVRPLSFPMDVTNKEEKLKIFLEFNKKATDFENIFSMFEEGPCDVKANLRAEGLIAQIQLLEEPGAEMNRSDYENLNKEIAQFIKVENTSDATLCQVGLTCQVEKERCVAETRRESLSKLYKKVVDFSKLECGEKGCSPTPKMMDYNEIFEHIDPDPFRKDRSGTIRPGARATELYVQEMHKLLDMFNAKVKPRYCRLYALDDGPFVSFSFIERCNPDGICSLCSSEPPEVTEGGMNTEKMGTKNNQMNMNRIGIAHNDFLNHLVIIPTITTLLILNVY